VEGLALCVAAARDLAQLESLDPEGPDSAPSPLSRIPSAAALPRVLGSFRSFRCALETMESFASHRIAHIQREREEDNRPSDR